jgi:hypothetical protein
MVVKKSVMKKVPTGVKVISILYYIGAALAVLVGLALLFGAGLFAGLMPEVLGVLGAVFFVIAGIFSLALAVLAFFIAKGLVKKQKWSRIIVIIFAILGFIGALFSLGTDTGSSIFSLIIDGVIGYYLLFNKEAKKFFA